MPSPVPVTAPAVDVDVDVAVFVIGGVTVGMVVTGRMLTSINVEVVTALVGSVRSSGMSDIEVVAFVVNGVSVVVWGSLSGKFSVELPSWTAK